MNPVKRVSLILALTTMLTPGFLFIKLAVMELPPLVVVTLRSGIAALIFGLILCIKRRPLPKDPVFWINSMVLAFFSSTFPSCLFCHAEKTIESALAAILNGSTPVFTAMLAHLFIPSDKLTPQKIIGIGLSA